MGEAEDVEPWKGSVGIYEQPLTSPPKAPVQVEKVELLGTFSFQRGLGRVAEVEANGRLLLLHSSCVSEFAAKPLWWPGVTAGQQSLH